MLVLKKLEVKFSEKSDPVKKKLWLISLRIPAGRQIRNPRKNTNKIVDSGSLNLSLNTKNNNIKMDGINVSNSVITKKN